MIDADVPDATGPVAPDEPPRPLSPTEFIEVAKGRLSDAFAAAVTVVGFVV